MREGDEGTETPGCATALQRENVHRFSERRAGLFGQLMSASRKRRVAKNKQFDDGHATAASAP